MDSSIFLAAPLPPACPPPNAKPFEQGELVLRLVAHNPPIQDDFIPNSQNPKKVCPRLGDKCRWAGISVWEDGVRLEVLEGITKLPKNQHLKFVVKVNVCPDTGLALAHEASKEHLTCWAYKSYDFTSNVHTIEQVNGDK